MCKPHDFKDLPAWVPAFPWGVALICMSLGASSPPSAVSRGRRQRIARGFCSHTELSSLRLGREVFVPGVHVPSYNLGTLINREGRENQQVVVSATCGLAEGVMLKVRTSGWIGMKEKEESRALALERPAIMFDDCQHSWLLFISFLTLLSRVCPAMGSNCSRSPSFSLLYLTGLGQAGRKALCHLWRPCAYPQLWELNSMGCVSVRPVKFSSSAGISLSSWIDPAELVQPAKELGGLETKVSAWGHRRGWECRVMEELSSGWEEAWVACQQACLAQWVISTRFHLLITQSDSGAGPSAVHAVVGDSWGKSL